VFDIQDAGARFYTYITTLGYALEAVTEKGIDFYKSKWGGKPYNQQIFTKIYHPKKLKFSKILVNPKVLKSKFLGEIQS